MGGFGAVVQAVFAAACQCFDKTGRRVQGGLPFAALALEG